MKRSPAAFSLAIVTTVTLITMYSNCQRAVLGSLNTGTGSGAGSNGAQSVGVGNGSCATNQVPIGIAADQSLICAATQTLSQTSCPSGESLYQYSSTGSDVVAVCVSNTSWDQTGSVCPVDQFLASYSGTGAIQCVGPNGGGVLNVNCPEGQYLNAIQNNVPVCLDLPTHSPSAILCPTNTYLADLNSSTPICKPLIWTTVQQSCASGSFALGFVDGQLICQANSITPTVGAGLGAVSCPAGQVLLGISNATASCSPAPSPDITYACAAGLQVSGIVHGQIQCTPIPTDGGTRCPEGQYLVGISNQGTPACASLPVNHLPGVCPTSTYPIGESNGALICIAYLNLADPTLLCSARQTSLCAVQNGFGSQTCNSAGTALSACVANSCLSGYVLTNNVCEPMSCTPGAVQSCSINNGSGAQFCGVKGTWSVCQVEQCHTGYLMAQNSCVSESCTPGNLLSCTAGPAFGVKSCTADGSGYGSCVVTSCQNGYALTALGCKDIAPPRITYISQPQDPTQGSSALLSFTVVDNESGVNTVTCTLDGTTVTPCASATPVNLQGLSNGPHKFTVTAIDAAGNNTSASALWSNVVCNSGASQSCTPANGVGAETCDVSTGLFGPCLATRCSAGYELDHGQCVALTCNPGYTAQGNQCVDKAAPTVQITKTPTDPTIGTSAEIDFTATDLGSGVATVTCAMDSQPAAICQSPLLLTQLTVGQHKVIITAFDQAGNSASATAQWHELLCAPGLQNTCAVTNGQGTQSCLADGSGYSSCVPTACNSGYLLSSGLCVSKVIPTPSPTVKPSATPTPVPTATATPAKPTASPTPKSTASPTATATPPKSTAICNGVLVAGYCFYEGGAGQSCDTVCANHAGCDIQGTRDFAGSAGSWANCANVMDNLGFNAPATQPNSGDRSKCVGDNAHQGVGCSTQVTDAGLVIYARVNGKTTDCNDSLANVRRVCACAK